MYQITLFSQYLHNTKRSFFAFLSCLPTSLLALIFLLLLLYNGFSVFYIRFPLPAKFPPPPPVKTLPGKSLKTISSSVIYAVKEQSLPLNLKTQLPLLPKSAISTIPRRYFSVLKTKKSSRRKTVIKVLHNGTKSKRFAKRINMFLASSSCKLQFFMTWISTLESFGDRERFSIESLFKSNPDSCLVIVSNSMDSRRGKLVLKPFLDKGLKIAAIKPDFDYIFKNTYAESWFNELKKGNVDPGEVSLGQNLSNLARLALLYKYGGIYIDTDVIILKSFGNLSNVIGAQTVDMETGNWSRLNNAVLIFEKKHPLIFKFIQEFSLTFNGNKWGHNGPYLVSRVVSRVNGRNGFNFTVLPPSAFYPVNWGRIRSLFVGPRDEDHSKWLIKKLEQIKRESLAVHLWNKQSRDIRVENGSIINHLLLDSCIFCNSSSWNLLNKIQ
ncbi:alpha 1 4-glycosyltransferase family protein [Euphorbia peplus]|nr:alpha 1 4-glycosyltransferase family protein [Euphorbia peplus]